MAVLNLIARGRAELLCRCRVARWLIGLLVLGAVSGPVRAQTPSAEYQVKAVFLFNFAQFVDWPASAFPTPQAPIVIAVLGKDPFGAYLDNLMRGERIGERPLVIRRCNRTEELAGCHLVFISRSESRDLEAIVARLKGQPLLTVSDADAFTRYGGMVRFVMEGGRIRLRINVEAARASQLTISSKVLRPDTLATPDKN
jgi:hypothetical protein